MKALDRKLLRDVRRLRGQVIAIALVVASGVALLVMALSTVDSLSKTTDAYYERYRFAQVFAQVKRAPERLARRIALIPGVQAVETRVVGIASLDVPGFAEPVIGQLVSIPETGEPLLNQLVLRAGRRVHPGRADEAVLSEPFAEAHGLAPGDTLSAVIHGKKRKLRIVGTGLSPEFVYAIGPGALMPDDRRFGVLWMGRDGLAGAYDLEGAFNEVSLTVLRGTDTGAVVARLDGLLDRYGGTGAYGREDQISNWFLRNEITQIENTATILPTIFLAVAAFLVNVVMARLVATERSEIGLMKAFGRSNIEVGWHYAKLVIFIAAVGILVGWGVGAWLGGFQTRLYTEFFQFPFLLYRPDPSAFLISAGVSLAAAILGAAHAVRRVVRLPPAEAMQPPAPPAYRKGPLAATRVGRWLDQSTRIILRQIVRWPVRSFFTAAGIAATVSVLVIAMQWLDSIDHLVAVHFSDAQRQDATVGFVEPTSHNAVHALARMPGVLHVEPMRSAGARFEAGVRSHRGGVEGIVPDARLSPVYDVSGRVIDVPERGLVLSTKLAEKLGVGRGDRVTVHFLVGARPVREIQVAALFETYIGTPAYMHIDALNRLLRQPLSMNLAHLLVDESAEAPLFARLRDSPAIAGVMLRRAAVDTFHKTMGETIMIFITFFVGFACTLAVGVVYNSARIALSERGRELATLRVLGFGRADISYILLGEIALLIVIGLPLGCLAGYGLAGIMVAMFETELFRVPFVIEPSTFGFAVLVTLAATIGSAALVRGRLDRLDLIAVLKTRE